LFIRVAPSVAPDPRIWPRVSGMTGPEHYRMAERALEAVAKSEDMDPAIAAQLVARAQVDATLALTAELL
jgi:hypothetical protein